MFKVKFSVVVPVYNTEKYLSKCLDSIINQTLNDIEIICVNDGSTDNSLKILKEYSNKDSRIKIINQKNLGPGSARNKGIDNAQGEYISFVDSDDWVELNFLEKTYNICKKNNLDLLIFASSTYNENNKTFDKKNNYYNLSGFDSEYVNTIFSYNDYTDLLFRIPTGPVNKVYRKNLLIDKDIRFPEDVYYEDNVFFFDVYLQAKRCIILRDFFYIRRYRENSITEKHDDKYFDLAKVFNYIIKIFKKTGTFNDFKIPLISYVVYILHWRYTLIESKHKRTFFKLIKKEFQSFNLSQNDFELLNKSTKIKYNQFMNTVQGKDLFIAYAAPPFSDTSAISMAKRIFMNDKLVDIIQNDISDIRSVDNSLNFFLENKVDKIFYLNIPTSFFIWSNIKKFVNQGLKEIEEFTIDSYDSVYSRTMFPSSHFLAFEYKLKHPETHWIAEFSDPMIYNMDGIFRCQKTNDLEFLNRVNTLLKKLNLPMCDDNVFLLTEYLPYVFADEIIFTNKSQRKFMIDKFPFDEIKSIISNKSKIKTIPIMPIEYYYQTESSYKLNSSKINLAYFGVFYGSRNLENLFYALENLDETIRDKVNFHIFTNDTEFLTILTDSLIVSDNIFINKYVEYTEFLNLSTKFDCLIVNDSEVKEKLSINPYLPSKLMDYLGSGSDIWAIYEEGSELEGYDVKYKSNLKDYFSLKETLVKIINDKFKSNIEIEKDEFEELKEISFLRNRMIFLNTTLKNELNYKNYFKNKQIESNKTINKLNKDNLSNINTPLNQISEELLIISKLKSYRIAYFLHRTFNSFIKGNISDKNIYLKWLFFKTFRKKNKYTKLHNPILKLVDKIKNF